MSTCSVWTEWTFGVMILSVSIFMVRCKIDLSPEVTIPDGRVRGMVLVSRDGRPYFAFTGIPYGKSKRFQASVPYGRWNGVKDATSLPERCAQVVVGLMDGMDSHLGSENCHYVNVYTPKESMQNANKLPVLVFVHGGGYTMGGGNDYGAGFLMDEDIVFVTFNYRLGALGFLSTGDGQIQGNLGLKDQVLALQWVQRNIHRFGGNPRRVTISGESAGGGAMGLHLISPMSRGLFVSAIVQSGSSLCPWSLNYRPEDTAKALAKAINCPTENSAEMVKCLKTIEIEKLMEPQAETRWFMEYKYPFIPSVEFVRPIGGGQRFLPDYPINLLKAGKMNKVPIIIGICQDEGLMVSNLVGEDPEMMADLNNNFTTVAPVTFMYDMRPVSTKRLEEASIKIKNFYFGPGVTIKGGLEQLDILTDLYSDTYFIFGIQTQAIYHSKYAPTYPYIFSHKRLGVSLMLDGLKKNEPVVTHGSELFYLFQMGFANAEMSEEDTQLSRDMVKLFVSFVKTGKPVATWGNEKIWEAVKYQNNLTAINWYNIDVNTMTLRKPFMKRLEFLHDIFTNELKFP